MNHEAGAAAAGFDHADVRGMLREVIDRATQHRRPLLIACAQRDLAQLLISEGDVAGAKKMAQAARVTFENLGAKGEIGKLDTLLEDSAMGRPSS